MDFSTIWHEVVNWLSLGAKWEFGAYRLFCQGHSYWSVLWRIIVITHPAIIASFCFFDLTFFIPRWLRKKIKQGKELVLSDGAGTLVGEQIVNIQTTAKHKIKGKIIKLVNRYGYWAFFFVSVLPILMFVPEIAAGICVSVYAKHGQKAVLKGFLFIFLGNLIKILYSLILARALARP